MTRTLTTVSAEHLTGPNIGPLLYLLTKHHAKRIILDNGCDPQGFDDTAPAQILAAIEDPDSGADLFVIRQDVEWGAAYFVIPVKDVDEIELFA